MIALAPEVRDAIAAGGAVVALESTIITHGMPFPDNVATALGVEAEIRTLGATPATIAVIDGVPTIGLDAASLEQLGAAQGVLKASRRDLAAVVAARRSAGTTVAATMFLAAKAGLGLFATGGIGGVHRGGEASLDISADLIELSRSPVAVVCAGAKSILDLGRTLEFLETHGVPVIGFGTDEFPAFYARHSGHRLDHRCETPEEVAALIAAHRDLGLPGGMLIANPVPEGSALDGMEIEAVIAEAVATATAEGVSGKAVTPYLLRRVVDRSGGRSLSANMALIRNNARVAARIALAAARH